MEDKVGVFICTGYGIGEALDIDALSKVATDEGEVAFCTTVDSCEGAGLEVIREQIEREELSRVVVAGISPRRYEHDVFPENVIVEPLGLRELVVWTQPPGEEDTQMMAEDYLRMGITRVGDMEPLEPFQPEEELSKRLLVVGGGLAGLSAALILAAQTTGGALGSMIAPAKILVGCSTVGLSGKEGPVLKATLRHGLVITGIIAIITIVASFF